MTYRVVVLLPDTRSDVKPCQGTPVPVNGRQKTELIILSSLPLT